MILLCLGNSNRVSGEGDYLRDRYHVFAFGDDEKAAIVDFAGGNLRREKI
ncbi:hypothetical protein EDF43_10483 [Rathayibacter sp. PhB179]|nr:hypothetical protein EDF49_10482 [Rathayibacter sp. PhB192]TCM28527.1 hypothetical protein EDF43_10483 [Rathayibacter sp. PhB179]